MRNRALSGWILILLLLAVMPAKAQISVKALPPSTIYSLANPDRLAYEVTPPAMDSIRMEDARFPSPYRYAVNLPVDIELIRDGKKEILPDGDAVWRIRLHASGATAITVYFDRFAIPGSGELFLYDPLKMKVIGAFTGINNSKEGYFATELIPGDQVILEYHQPATLNEPPLLHISEIAYAYRGIGMVVRNAEGFGSSGPCEVNSNCPEGANWRQQAKGVALISVKKGSSNYWCTGSLLNNVRNDHAPYFLTADHCGFGATPENLLQWIFYFHYEAPDCQDPLDIPVAKSITGAVLKSHGGNLGNTGSDFYLVLLKNEIPVDYDVYFNGWSREAQPPAPGVTIHHPEGDIKKISTYQAPLISSTYGSGVNPCFWKVSWVTTANGFGVTEPGSSGSPVFDALQRIVGTLTGGTSSCDSAHLADPDFYGKFSWSWASNGTDSTTRLRDWLDPDSTGVINLNGVPLGINEPASIIQTQVFPNPFQHEVNIRFSGQFRKPGFIRVFNIMGKEVFMRSLLLKGSELVNVDLPDLSPGVYFLKIYIGEETSVQKIVRL